MVSSLRLISAPGLAVRLLPLAALLAGPATASAQKGGPVSGTVQRETERRLGQAQEAESLAAEGDNALLEGRTAEAVNRYQAALDRIAPGAASLAATRQSIVQRFAETSVVLAREQAENGEFQKARATLQAVLDDRAAPGYPPAKTLLAQLDDPDRFNPARTPGHSGNVRKIKHLFLLAQGMVDIADYKAAKGAYEQILAIDSTNTAARRGLEQVERTISAHMRSERDYTRIRMINEVDRQWETAVPGSQKLPGTLSPGEDLTGGDNAAASARLKMNQLVLDRLAMAETPLEEALSYLARKSQEVDTAEPDPARKGVNIVFNPGDKPASDFKAVTLDLRGVTLGDAIRSINDLTQTRFSTQGNTITITPAGAGNRVVMRIFRVPPGFLTRSGSAAPETEAGGDPFAQDKISTGLKITRLSAKEWLIQNGVPFPEGTSADYSAGSNQLIVRNTEANLELVQTVVDSTTDNSQRQVLISVVLLRTEQRHLQELGYDWLVDSARIAGSGVFAGGGTFGNAVSNGAGRGGNYGLLIPNTGDTAVPIGYNPVTAGLRGAFELKNSPTIDDLITSGTADGGLTANRSPGIVGIAGAFTSPQFQGILRGLNQKTGIDLSVAQTLILKAGQKASASSLRTIRFPTEFDPPQIPQTIQSQEVLDLELGIITNSASGTAPVTPTTPQSFEDKDTGSSIEVEATVGEDGHTVDLNLSVVFRDFDGFINFGSPISSEGQILTDNKIFQPVISKIEESAQVLVYDGATVAIGGLSDAKYETINDKVPLLGDLPFLGRFFRSDVNQVTRKAAVYFVTVKVVDPGGIGRQEAATAAEESATLAAPPGP